MGVIVEKDLILFLKNIFNLSDKVSSEEPKADVFYQNSTVEIVEINNTLKEYSESGYYEDVEEDIFDSINQNVKDYILDEMADERISYDEFSSYAESYAKENNRITTKYDLYKVNLNQILDKKGVNMYIEFERLQSAVKEEFKDRVIKYFKEHRDEFPDEY